MAKMKVFELKNLINEKIHGNIESKDILNFLEKSMGVKKTHSSNLEDHEVKAVKEHFIPSANKTSETPATKKARSEIQNSEMSQELKPQASMRTAQPQRGQGYPVTPERPVGRGQEYPEDQSLFKE